MDSVTTEFFLQNMPQVKKYQTRLENLNNSWENIKLLGEIVSDEGSNNYFGSISDTQTSFEKLQERLINNLISESIKKLTLDITSKAQVAVDIVIRNLFERTADVGFLATDYDITNFLSEEITLEKKEKIEQRLVEYVKKYSVYDEIIIIDNYGKVVAHLDKTNPIDDIISADPLIRKTINTKEPFVESFCKTDLLPKKEKALIYSAPIIAEDTNESKGVLCLSFRFKDEMEKVFTKLKKQVDGSVILLLEKNGTVISSSDITHVPIGASIEISSNGEYSIIYFRGIAYIAKTNHTKGYQDFYGLGWLGHVMIPINVAFNLQTSSALHDKDTLLVKKFIDSSNSFPSELTDIFQTSEEINQALKRVVWNGKVLSSQSKSIEDYNRQKALLNHITSIGQKTTQTFSNSIYDLYETVLSSSLEEIGFLSSLAIDIMDRNLYERANDCRWWALTTKFREILAQDTFSNDDIQILSKILRYINSLYTVYTNLFIYDSQRRILAVSNPDCEDILGTIVNDAFVNKTLLLKDSQKYSVSDFESSIYYDYKHTYIYGASITHLKNSSNVLGGIGIVFDSEPQFDAMLKDVLPNNEGSYGFFVDSKKNIISTTSPQYQAGDILNIDNRFYNLENGKSFSDIAIFEDYYYIIGATKSSGYREYKVSDDYTNDILSIIMLKLSPANDYDSSMSDTITDLSIKNSLSQTTINPQNDSKEIATFSLGKAHFAFFTSNINEAMSWDKNIVTKIPGISNYIEGVYHFHNKPITVFNLYKLLNQPEPKSYDNCQIIVGNYQNHKFGVIVDKLGIVTKVDSSAFQKVDPVLGQSSSFINSIVQLNDENNNPVFVEIINPKEIVEI
jgi:chemotaxis signal transduction protein